AGAAVPGEPRDRLRGGRDIARTGGADDDLHDRPYGVRGGQRGLRGVLHLRAAGPRDDRGRVPAEGRERRDRRDRRGLSRTETRFSPGWGAQPYWRSGPATSRVPKPLTLGLALRLRRTRRSPASGRMTAGGSGRSPGFACTTVRRPSTS